ncbi:MAG: glycosyltransferase [Clostridia bacterium]|nr:glycosyltransferase [Clostridia bacterium]
MNIVPKISLIMSVYNGEDYLAETIESVLSQTFTEWEFIIINDCSIDNTSKILAEYASNDDRIKVHTNETNLRLPSSLNKALSLAKGRYIARMDADDICMPDRLQKQYDFMEENPNVDLSSCRFMTLKNGVYASGGCGGKDDENSIKALLLVTNPILHPGIIAKAEVIKELGYDKNFTCTEDMELWTRFVLNNKRVEILSEYLMIYRLHDKQITETTLDKQKNEVIKVQKNYFSKLLEPMTEEQEEFYINGVYFRKNTNISEFIKFYKWAKSADKTNNLDKEALNYAFFEILAEYKRKGISKSNLIKGMMSFGIPFIIKELYARKKRARADGIKCIKAAESIGLEMSGGTLEFPHFKKK